jgi:hypothetical protein
VTATAERRRGSRVSPRRRRRPSRHAASPAPAEDRRRFWIYVRDPGSGLLISDGLTYIGQRLAQRQAAKLARHYGQPAEARLSPRA